MNEQKINTLLNNLENGKYYSFDDWSFVPRVCAGVYTIWKEKTLIYVGMSGRSMTAQTISEHRLSNSKEKGLITRLKSHASGRRSGDQFCIYIGDKLVLPNLKSDQIAQIAKGNLSLDKLIKKYIHENLVFRFVETENAQLAYEVENAIKSGKLKAGKPLLNPK